MTQDISDLLNELSEVGGAIVSSDSCSEVEIANAQADGRFAVGDWGMGYVLRTPGWLQVCEHAAELFSKAKDARKYVIAKADCSAIDPDAKYFVMRYDAGAEHGVSGQHALLEYAAQLVVVDGDCRDLAMDLLRELRQSPEQVIRVRAGILQQMGA